MVCLCLAYVKSIGYLAMVQLKPAKTPAMICHIHTLYHTSDITRQSTISGEQGNYMCSPLLTVRIVQCEE